MRLLLSGMMLLLILLVTACPRIPLLSARQAPGSTLQAAGEVEPIRGTVDFSVPGRLTQGTLGEIAQAATVALINTSDGYTIATTTTTADGRFVLYFANSYRPAEGIYYLEAVKGLSAGTTLPNRVGADLARVRTVIQRRDGVWRSMSGTVVMVNATSTALSIILSLRSMTPPVANRQIDPASLIGVMGSDPETADAPSSYTYSNSALMSPSLVRDAYLLVNQALASDRDPFKNIALDSTDPQYDRLLNAPLVLTVAALFPNVQITGGTLDIVGSGFSATPSENVVEFTNVSGGPVPATVSTVTADRARMTVTVPPGAVTGPVAVTLAGRKMIGPTFYLALQSGHEAIDSSGNLYVANETFGTISVITPQGQVRTFATGLTSPRALTLRNDRIYVTCAGAKRGVVSIDLRTPTNPIVDHGTAGVIADPRGIAFDGTGRCFVSDGTNNLIYRIDSAASAPVSLAVSGTALSSPRGIAFGSDGRLYVANYGDNRVLTIDVTTNASSVFKEGFTFPWGVAFDPIGNLYVTNNRGNSVYRWHRATDTLSPYADMPSPGGVVADRSGYIYAIDNTSNNVHRITSQGDSAVFASGISSPTGIVKVGNTLYVLSSTNNSLVSIDTATTALTTLARGFNSPFGLAYDDARDCFYVSNPGNGTITRVNRSNGAAATILAGTGGSVGGASGIAYRAGRLYIRSNRRVVSYDVTNFAAPTVQYESLMLANQGVAKDTSASTNAGSYYIASGAYNRILRVIGDGQEFGSRDGTNRVVVFKDAAGDPNLSGPRDLSVDGSGYVWVVNPAANGGKITTYAPNGSTRFAPITDGLSNPLGINRDASTIWVANHDNSTVTGYSAATGAKVATIPTGTDHPRNLVVSGTSLYLVLDEGVGRIASYATAPSYARIYSGLTGYNDIEVGSDGSLYVLNNAGRRIAADLSTDNAWYSNYHAPNFFWQGGGDIWMTDNIRFMRAGAGDWVYRLIGVTDWNSGPTLAGVDSNGNVYLNGTSICSHDVVNRIKPGPPQEEWSYPVVSPITCWVPNTGAFSSDSLGNFYISRYNGLDVTVVDAAGSSRAISGRSSDHTTYGAWVEPDGTSLYQSVQSHHRVEQINVGTGARTILPYGLSSAEM